MPTLKKKALSLYLRTGCQRQLVLNLYNDQERRQLGMSPRQTARAGAGYVGMLGYEWQDEKVSELDRVFGPASVHVNPRREGNRPGTLDLDKVLPKVRPYQFVIEGRYDPDTTAFKSAVGFDTLQDLHGQPLTVGNAFPDIVQVLPSMAARPIWETEAEREKPTGAFLEVLPDGDTRPLDSADTRLRLRVIDVKLASEPGAHYFAEVVYYSVTLAAWLSERGYLDRFVVVAAPAVWPGSYEASKLTLAKARIERELREPTAEELASALEEDIEVAPFDVFAPRLAQFFREELPHVLLTPWRELPWHVSFACQGCEFLGYPWLNKEGQPSNDPLHCWPTAEREGHLSRVAGLSRGSARQLALTVPDVAALAHLTPSASVFDVSPTLRAKRTVYPQRAHSLGTDTAGIIPDSGGDALMPRWPDLHICLFLEYDLSSAISAAFGIRASWREPLPYGSGLIPERKRWDGVDRESDIRFQDVFLVDERDLARERKELLNFLRALRGILDEVRKQDETDVAAGRRGDPAEPDKAKRSTYQIYLWDEAQRKHLARVVGRHLGAILADARIRDLAWLFPPPELLANPDEASYRSPFTLVSNVVQNTVAAPVPHHYTLLEIVRTYRPEGLDAPSAHPLFRDPLSDLIPAERIHEMWARRGDWLQTASTLKQTTQRKLYALALVTRRLETDLKLYLARSAAPPLARIPRRLANVPPHSHLWFEYARLNYALNELDEHTLRSMPAHEREARFKSAHLLRRLEGAPKAEALERLASVASEQFNDPDDLVVYTLAPDSREFNVRPPALGFALAPRTKPAFLSQAAFPLVKDLGLKGRFSGSVADAGLTQVSVVALDRVNLLIALKPWRDYKVPELEGIGLDLATDVMLDPVGQDFLSKKVRLTLEGIGRPSSAHNDETALRALGVEADDEPATTPECPASEFLWQAPALAASPVERDTAAARAVLEAAGVRLNESQWDAWRAALTRRLVLVWGPPGTGKSQTLRTVVAGAAWAANAAGRPLRVLIASQTYNAVDNVLLEADALLARVLPEKPYRLFRLQSDYNVAPAELAGHPDIAPITVKTVQAPPEVLGLQALLDQPDGIVVVGAPSQQLHNLAIATKNKTKKETAERTQRRWFDLILIDEASQLDVAESSLIVSKGAEGAAFVLAGDDLQLPPIHPAVPPTDLDHVVGSIYGYVRHHHGIRPEPLQVNYRSCETLLGLTRRAGYDPRLRAHHQDLRLSPLEEIPFPAERPANWPAGLFWTPNWARLLDPSAPASCFVYVDEVASQANDFEAEAVAAVLRLLFGRMDRQLAGELDDGGAVRTLAGVPNNPHGFWERAVGVVTPHRAQMAKVVARLQEVFPDHDAGLIRRAVDTVERFQGQQRDVIVASFGLGDPDLIRAEDEFLYNLNRFNVLASRARAKLIVFTTRSLVDHLAADADVLEQSRLLKYFVESFCLNPIPLALGYINAAGTPMHRSGTLRKR